MKENLKENKIYEHFYNDLNNTQKKEHDNGELIQSIWDLRHTNLEFRTDNLKMKRMVNKLLERLFEGDLISQ